MTNEQSRPPWVAAGLAAILGLDQESITQMVLPDLESNVNETKLRSHLQDFLGPSPQAQQFIDRYTSLRFPRLTPVPPHPPAQDFLKPSAKSASSSSGLSHQRKATSSSSGTTPTGRPYSQGEQSIPDALESAFGPGGKLYQKNKEADGSGSHVSRPTFGGSTGGGASGSGSTTPSGRGQLRHAGAVTYVEAKPRGMGGGSERNSQKGKAREEKIWDHPKSDAVKKLEKTLANLKRMQDGEGKLEKPADAKECFCQARLHPLSTYTPLCASCGLILCHIQLAHLPCPSCVRPLLSPSALARLILRVQDDIEGQLAKEQEDRDEIRRAEQRALAAQAAFPYLSGASSAASTASVNNGQDQTRKVLSIGGGGKGKGRGKITVTTTHTPPPIAPSPRPEEEKYSEDTINRPRSPPLERQRVEKELAKVMKWRAEEDRPWGDMKAVKRGERVWAYVESPILVLASHEDRVGRRKGRKGRGGTGEGVDGRVIPGAGPSAASIPT